MRPERTIGRNGGWIVAATLAATILAVGCGSKPEKKPRKKEEGKAAGTERVKFAVRPVGSFPVRPSGQEQRAGRADAVVVGIPGGTLREAKVLTLGSVADPPKTKEGLKPLCAYEISLGDLHEFASELTLEVRYDPAKLEAGRPADGQIVAMRWDEPSQAWQALPCRVDAARGVAVARTRKLSLVGWYKWAAGGVQHAASWFHHRFYEKDKVPCLETPHFAITYDATADSPRWKGETGVEEPYKALYADARVFAYVKDVAYYLEKTYSIYRANGLPPLTDSPLVVNLGPGLSGEFPAFYHYASRRILMSTDKITSDRKVIQHNLAHELFHALQAVELGHDINKLTDPLFLWWMESTAEYASCRLAWDLDLIGGSTDSIYPLLLEYPLTHAGPPPPDGRVADPYNELSYDRGCFVEFLVARGGAKFVPMYKAAMAGHNAGGKGMAALAEYLKANTPLSMARHARNFAGYFLFGSACPLARSGFNADPLCCVVNPNRQVPLLPARVADDKDPDPISYRLALAKCYTAKAWAFRVEPDAPGGPRPVAVSATALSDNVVVDVYVLRPGQRGPIQPSPAVSITEAGVEQFLSVHPSDIAYAVAVNQWPDVSGSASVTVRDARPAAGKPAGPPRTVTIVPYVVNVTMETQARYEDKPRLLRDKEGKVIGEARDAAGLVITDRVPVGPARNVTIRKKEYYKDYKLTVLGPKDAVVAQIDKDQFGEHPEAKLAPGAYRYRVRVKPAGAAWKDALTRTGTLVIPPAGPATINLELVGTVTDRRTSSDTGRSVDSGTSVDSGRSVDSGKSVDSGRSVDSGHR